MSKLALPTMKRIAGVRPRDWPHFLMTRAIAHALWKGESHRVGGPVHGNDWDHWLKAEMLETSMFSRRVEARAYYLWQAECERTNCEIHGESARFWLLAEELERKALYLRVLEGAYYRWVDECRMIGDTVHGNDWYHWFAAENDAVAALATEVGPVFFSFEEHEEAVSQKNEQDQQGGATTVGADAHVAMDGSGRSFYGRQVPISEFSKEGAPSMIGKSTDLRQDTSLDSEVTPPPMLFVESNEIGDGDSVERVFWTVDLSRQEFANKVIATDPDATEVLAVADSLERLAEMVSDSEFRRMLLQRYGDESAYLIHSGPTNENCLRDMENPRRASSD